MNTVTTQPISQFMFLDFVEILVFMVQFFISGVAFALFLIFIGKKGIQNKNKICFFCIGRKWFVVEYQMHLICHRVDSINVPCTNERQDSARKNRENREKDRQYTIQFFTFNILSLSLCLSSRRVSKIKNKNYRYCLLIPYGYTTNCQQHTTYTTQCTAHILIFVEFSCLLTFHYSHLADCNSF